MSSIQKTQRDIATYCHDLWAWLLNGVRIGWLDLLITPLQSLIITINYNNSQYIFSRTLLPGLPRTRSILILRGQSQSQSYVTIGGQSASLSWNKAPIWDLRPDLYYCQTVAGLLMWGALSDERTGLSFARVTAVISLFPVCTVYILHVINTIRQQRNKLLFFLSYTFTSDTCFGPKWPSSGVLLC
jgi:hypothetical protein